MQRDMKLSIEKALEMGYTHAATKETFEGNRSCTSRIDHLKAVDFEENQWVVCEKEMTTFGIHDKFFKEALDDHLCDQDEVNNEDGSLEDAVAEIDFSEITAKVNNALATVKYYSPSEYILEPPQSAPNENQPLPPLK